jgi:oligopeptide/dipeptide ABC transporter ATP-binding protein
LPSLLAIDGLTVSYEGERSWVRVLDEVALTVEPGESLGIVGESGSGKTVLIRAVLGMLRAPWRIETGRITLEGELLTGKSEEQLARLRGKVVALTAPEPRKHLNPLLRIGQQIANVIIAHAEVPRRTAMERAIELLAQVGIPDPRLRAFAYPHELSGGMCQRVVIAMALAHAPKLILADEPTAGLDVTISRQILDLMHDLVERTKSALVLVSRDLGVIAHYCRRVVVMHSGRVVELDEVASFFGQAVHPYSRNLLRAAQAARDTASRAAPYVSARSAPGGAACSYTGRCPIVIRRCHDTKPALDPVAATHLVRCHRRNEILGATVAV